MVDSVFSLSGMLAGVGWIGLILLPRRGVAIAAARLVIPGMIGIVYVTFFVLFFDSIPEGGGFGSLAAVATLFTVEELLLCGWIHYLAFDLFVGSWEVEDAQTRGISHWFVIPCLLATFMAGPAGLLLYLLLRGGYALKAQSSPASA